jgi:hypothetical protein
MERGRKERRGLEREEVEEKVGDREEGMSVW